MIKNSCIIFVGIYNFGKTKRAADFRIKAFCSLNSLAGYTSYVIDGSDMKNSVEYTRDFRQLKFSFIGNSLISEICFIYNKRKNLDYLQIYSSHFIVVLYYSIIAKIFRKKTILHLVEARSTFGFKGLYHYLNAKLYDFFSHRLVSKSIFITDYLRSYDGASVLNTLVIPPLSQSKVVTSPYESREKRIVFVTTTGHLRLIENVINDFTNSNISISYSLSLIISGDPMVISNLKNRTNRNYDIYSEMDYSTMLELMRKSYFGLLPLYDNDRDKCRYPNKIVDYLSAGLPLITLNSNHEVLRYLDSKTAIISNSKDFSEAFNLISKTELNTSHKVMSENAFALFKEKFSIESHFTSYLKFLT